MKNGIFNVLILKLALDLLRRLARGNNVGVVRREGDPLLGVFQESLGGHRFYCLHGRLIISPMR